MLKYHYVYRITNTQENKHYYGVRTSKIEPKLDLGFKYFSSSSDKQFIIDQKENKSIFKYKVIKMFETRKEANMYEHLLHTRFQVHVNKKFYNLSISSGGEKFAMPNTVYAKDLITGNYTRVSTQSYINNDNLVTDMYNMRNYRDLKTGLVSRISIDEINLNPDRYEPADKNMVTVKNILTNNTIKVSYSEFENNKFLVGPRTKYFYFYDNNVYRRNDINRLKIDIFSCYIVSKEIYLQIMHGKILAEDLTDLDFNNMYQNKMRVVEKSTYTIIHITPEHFDTEVHSKKIRMVNTVNLISNTVERVSLYEYYKRKELLIKNSSKLFVTQSNHLVRRIDVKEELITPKKYIKINDTVLAQYINYLNFSSPNNDI